MSTDEKQEAVSRPAMTENKRPWTTNRTRAEIQAEIEKLQTDLENVWPQKGAQVYCKAEVTDSEDDDVEILIDGTGCFTTVPLASLIHADDLIPREEHERALLAANTRTDKVVLHLNARDAVAYLVNDMDDAPAMSRSYTHDHNGNRYSVTVQRVVAKNATTDNDHMVEPADAEPIGYANRMSDGAWSGMFLSARTARTCAEFGDWAETAIPLYRHPAPPADDAIKAAYRKGREDAKAEYVVLNPSLDGFAPPAAKTAVAPKGVVEELRAICRKYAIAFMDWSPNDKVSREQCQCADKDLNAALSRITELPEPKEWVREAVENYSPLKNLTPDERRDLAAALLESAKEADDE